MADEFKLLKRRVLGEGSYGTVSFASPVNSEHGDVDFAVKSADINKSCSLRVEESFLYHLYRSPYIVRCYGHDVSMENGKSVFNLFLEYAPGGTLADLIRNKFGGLPEYEVGWYTYLLLSGLKHIHELGFVHCDLKPENILVFPTQDGTLNNLKIADLGLAKNAGDDTVRPTFVNGRCYKHRGTPLYSSPESVLDGVHESGMDIWSLGCVVMEMITGEPAYPEGTGISSDEKELDEILWRICFKIELPKIHDDESNISDSAKDFLGRCFVRDYKERWSVDKLLNHPFILNHVELLRGQGAVTDPPEMVNEAGPTVWLLSTSAFIDPSTLQSICGSLGVLPVELWSKNREERSQNREGGRSRNRDGRDPAGLMQEPYRTNFIVRACQVGKRIWSPLSNWYSCVGISKRKKVVILLGILFLVSLLIVLLQSYNFLWVIRF